MNRVVADNVGTDGFLSPDDYLELRLQWGNKGGNATDFDRDYKGNRNPNNSNYLVGK